MEVLYVIIAAVIGYLLGSIPFGLIITRLGGGGDIRQIGSGNIGATNVLRTGRKDLALLTLLLDAGKAALAAMIFAVLWGNPYNLIAGAAALIGHCYPLWLRFRGGKGVATFFGLLFATFWQLGVIAVAFWLAIAYVYKMSSFAALVSVGVSPFLALAMGRPDIAIMTAVLAVVIFIRHRPNIGRIILGTEPRIGSKK